METETIEPPSGAEDRTILVVDDEELVEEMVEEQLKSLGYGHVSFNDPTEALEYFIRGSRKIAGAIIDLTMPEMSGTKLADKLLKIKPDLRVMIITGHMDERARKAGESPTVHKTVIKPMARNELGAAVADLLGDK